MKASVVVAMAALAVWSSGCASAGIAGGDVVAPGTEPRGDVVARFRIGRCEDRHGGRLAEEESRISVVRVAGGHLVLVERRPGYDSFVVKNGWSEAEVRVFQLAYKRAASGPYLREYRTPKDASAFGRLAVVRQVRSWGDSRRGFRASYTDAALLCDLSPDV
jgi:hypothetical protein